MLYLITNNYPNPACKSCHRPGGHKVITRDCQPILVRREDKDMLGNGTLIPVPWPFSLFFTKAQWVKRDISMVP